MYKRSEDQSEKTKSLLGKSNHYGFNSNFTKQAKYLLSLTNEVFLKLHLETSHIGFFKTNSDAR